MSEWLGRRLAFWNFKASLKISSDYPSLSWIKRTEAKFPTAFPMSRWVA